MLCTNPSGFLWPQFKLTHYRPSTLEHNTNYVPPSFFPGEAYMFRAIVEEAAALASLALFLGMIAIWAQVIPQL